MKQPTVRFHDLDSTLRRHGGQNSNSADTGTGSSPDSDEETTDAESTGGHDDESESDNKEGNPNSVQSQADTQQSQRPYSDEPSEHLIVEDIANLNSHVLRDLLSDEPITAPKPSQPMPPPIMCSEPRIIQESDLFF